MRNWDLESHHCMHKNITQVTKRMHKLKLPKQHKNQVEIWKKKKPGKESSNQAFKWPQKVGGE